MNKIIVGIESRMTDIDDKWEVVNDYQFVNNLSQYVIGLKSALKNGKIPEMSDYPYHYRLSVFRIKDDDLKHEIHSLTEFIEVKNA